MIEEWQWARGTALVESGIDLLDLKADQLYSAAYALMMRRMAMGKEVNDGLDKVKGAISEALRMADSGLPSIASMGFLPLNHDEFSGEESIPPELLGGGGRG